MIDKLLEKYLPRSNARLHQAVRYTVLLPGKRLRPQLVYGAGKAVNALPEKLDCAAVAVELIHAYSLIHDDLPAMDNDDFRRGKPSCHKQFGEATAILAGDALQSLAFEVLSENQDARQIKILANAIGGKGMVLGQSEDLLKNENITHTHRLKTGCLITASVQLGLLCGNDNQILFEKLTQFSEHFGLAFQLRDDFIDGEHEKSKEAFQQEIQKSEAILNAVLADVSLLKLLCEKLYETH